MNKNFTCLKTIFKNIQILLCNINKTCKNKINYTELRRKLLLLTIFYYTAISEVIMHLNL